MLPRASRAASPPDARAARRFDGFSFHPRLLVAFTPLRFLPFALNRCGVILPVLQNNPQEIAEQHKHRPGERRPSRETQDLVNAVGLHTHDCHDKADQRCEHARFDYPVEDALMPTHIPNHTTVFDRHGHKKQRKDGGQRDAR